MDSNKQRPPDGNPDYVGLGLALRERRDLAVCANAVGLAVLLYLLLRASLPTYITRLLLVFAPHVRYFNEHLIAPAWVIGALELVCFVLSCAIPFLLYALFLRIPLRVALPMRRPKLTLLMPAVFISLAVSVLGSLASQSLAKTMRLFNAIPVMPAIHISLQPEEVIFTLLNVCLLPALMEEIIYRGVLMQSLRGFGDGFALTISAAVFGALHLNFVQAPTAFLMGLALGYFVLRTGSIWTGVIIHMVNNLVALVQQAIGAQLSTDGAALLETGVALFCLLMGLLSLVVLARGTGGLFQLQTRPSAYSSGQKAQLFLACPAVIIALVLVASLSLRNIQTII